VANLQITAAGRKRVASEDFAKTLVHVIDAADDGMRVSQISALQAGTGKPLDCGFQLVASYVAMNLLVDETNFVELPAEGDKAATAMCDFMNANDKEIRAVIKQTISSPAYIAHAILCHGYEGLEEVLAELGVKRA